MEALPLADEVLQVPSTAVLHDDVDILLVPLERWRRQERGREKEVGEGGAGKGGDREGSGRGRRGIEEREGRGRWKREGEGEGRRVDYRCGGQEV